MFPIETQGAVDVISLSVALNHENADKLHDTINRRPSAGQAMIVLDMSDVPLIDSAGLESLLDVQDSLRETGGAIKLAALSQLCEDILRVTGIAPQFEIYHDAKAAVRSFVR